MVTSIRENFKFCFGTLQMTQASAQGTTAIDVMGAACYFEA